MRNQHRPQYHNAVAILCLIGLLLAFVACTSESYKSGDGDYSYLRSDFSMITTNSEGKVVSFVTDADRSLTLTNPVTVEKIKADTTYRALVYFDETTDTKVDFRGMRLIGVAKPFKVSKTKPMKTDPTGWESIWISYNGSYLNLALNLKVGVNDDENAETQQVIGIAQDSIVGNHTYYSLYHDQNGVPEYYTYKSYLSVPLGSSFKSGDMITVTVNTYDGVEQKTVIVP